jgi:hypothetical protein
MLANESATSKLKEVTVYVRLNTLFLTLKSSHGETFNWKLRYCQGSLHAIHAYAPSCAGAARM